MMSQVTSVYNGLKLLDNRLSEIDILLNEAEKIFENKKKESTYNTLCRSAQVLLSAHFEGYISDLITNYLSDINDYSDFKNSNNALKKVFCEYYLGTPQQKEKGAPYRIKELIILFEEFNMKYTKECILYDANNKNPKETILDKIASKFGIPEFFNILQTSNIDDIIFGDNFTESKKLKTFLRKNLEIALQSYPYKINMSILNLDTHKPRNTLWKDFLDAFLTRRHNIVHGKEIDNFISHMEIEKDKIKLEVLIYIFTYLICNTAKINQSPLIKESPVSSI